MKYADVIIVGGGPAGSTCAWKLNQSQVDCLLLDAQKFPRLKLCAGWITKKVIDQLELNEYPDIQLNANYVSFFGIHRKINAKSYAIRRYDFDDWLLRRSGVEVIRHKVHKIEKHGRFYIIDNSFRCQYLVGAGGTYCPVYRSLFKQFHPRNRNKLICCLEQEIKYNYKEKASRTWFFENKFLGYAWCISKKHGYLNIGVGGLFKDEKVNIKTHWDLLINKLERLNIVKNYAFKPSGYLYYIRDRVDRCKIGNAYIIGDAAGLATKDIGEGIGPAVESGMIAADSIINHTKFSLHAVTQRSNPVSMRILLFLRQVNSFMGK